MWTPLYNLIAKVKAKVKGKPKKTEWSGGSNVESDVLPSQAFEVQWAKEEK